MFLPEPKMISGLSLIFCWGNIWLLKFHSPRYGLQNKMLFCRLFTNTKTINHSVWFWNLLHPQILFISQYFAYFKLFLLRRKKKKPNFSVNNVSVFLSLLRTHFFVSHNLDDKNGNFAYVRHILNIIV